MPRAIVFGSFDDLRSRHVRLLHEASRVGPVEVRLMSDAAVRAATGKDPAFPQAEREYVLNSIRYVDRVVPTDGASPGPVPADAVLVDESRVSTEGFPPVPEPPVPPGKKVVVTGCYDWLHSGHVAFFEEVARLGALWVIVGHDATITFLKGPGHPMFPQAERAYMVGAIRHVTRVLVSSGMGWLDAAPEIGKLKPDIYAVNEDGDRPEKREFCAAHGLEYRVLKRIPHEGLPRRESTRLRGF